jgi:hypothetical protein
MVYLQSIADLTKAFLTKQEIGVDERKPRKPSIYLGQTLSMNVIVYILGTQSHCFHHQTLRINKF